MTWTNKLWKFNTTPDDVEMTALQADITAKANGDTGAPLNQPASMAANSVDTSQLVAASVNQGKITTVSGTVSGSVAAANPGPTGENIILAGGSYNFYPQSKRTTSGQATGLYIATDWLIEDPPDPDITGGFDSTSYVTNAGVFYVSGTGGVHVVQYRYVQASPPYDLGDGLCHLFVFCQIHKTTGKLSSIYVAPEAPWHYHGPTDIRAARNKLVLVGEEFDYRKLRADALFVSRLLSADGNPTPRQMKRLRRWLNVAPTLDIASVTEEPSQSIKNADMNLIPHPFLHVRKDHEVILLDPVSDLSAQLSEIQQAGDELVDDLLRNGFFKISNSELSRVGPMGVKTVSYRWK